MSIQVYEGATLDCLRENPIEILRKMLLIRIFEEKVEELFLVKGMLIGPAHLYLGQEAIAVGICSNLKKEDIVITTYRGHGHAIAKGVSIKKIMAELFGKKTGTCKGLGGSMHVAIDVENGILYATAIVGSGIPIAAGIALANKYQGKNLVTVCFFGDGAVNTGAFHEGLNIAALWKLPVIFVCENNLYAMSTHISRSLSSKSIAERASSYNMDVFIVDGNDVLSVYKLARELVEKVRNGIGPFFIEARTYKMKGHGVYDPALYRDKEEVKRWLERDPIKLFKEKLIKENIITEREFENLRSEIVKEVEESIDFAIKSDYLDFNELYNLVWV